LFGRRSVMFGEAALPRSLDKIDHSGPPVQGAAFPFYSTDSC
jgi:hypothetical protein